MIIPKVKICCISSIGEANLAISMGASALGLVSEMPSGPGVISENDIIQIASAVPSNINTFLLTSKQDANSIVKQLKRCKTTTVQIVDELLHGSYEEIRNELPHIKIVQVVHVQNDQSLDLAIDISKQVDVILLDSGNQNLQVKELGGTGRIHDWSISRKIVKNVDIPVFLAGGLNSQNITDAVKSVQPYGVDLCSGVRVNGNLDKNRLIDFFNKINSI